MFSHVCRCLDLFLVVLTISLSDSQSIPKLIKTYLHISLSLKDFCSFFSSFESHKRNSVTIKPIICSNYALKCSFTFVIFHFRLLLLKAHRKIVQLHNCTSIARTICAKKNNGAVAIFHVKLSSIWLFWEFLIKEVLEGIALKLKNRCCHTGFNRLFGRYLRHVGHASS